MATYYVQESTKIIPIGRQGENSARQIAFDISAWAEEYGDGTPVLLHQRCGDETSYPATVAVEEGYAVWAVSSTDTAYSGNGRCELQYIADGAVVKSRVYTTYVSESIEEILSEAGVEPAAGWIADLLEQIQAMLDDAEILSDEDIYNLLTAYFEENPTASGEDGVSVTKLEQTIKSTESGGANVWTITLSNGSAYDFTVYNGAKGASAYEIAVANGFSGTEAEWLASLEGEAGTAATIKVGTVTTGAAGTAASVNNSGTESAAVLDFVIPRGADGTSSTDEYDKFLLIVLDLDNNTATIPTWDDAEADYETVYNLLVGGVLPTLYVATNNSLFAIASVAYFDQDAQIIYFLGTFGEQPMENLLYMTCSESGWSYKATPFSSGSPTTSGLPDASEYDDGCMLVVSNGEWVITNILDAEDISEVSF